MKQSKLQLLRRYLKFINLSQADINKSVFGAFDLFRLTIVLSVLRFTDSYYPFGFFKLFSVIPFIFFAFFNVIVYESL
jgi:hypothetical protein